MLLAGRDREETLKNGGTEEVEEVTVLLLSWSETETFLYSSPIKYIALVSI